MAHDMLFNTISFYAVFIVFLTIYAVLHRTSRTLMMLYVVLFSLFFFARINPGVSMLLPLTALLSWSMTRRMNECKGPLRRRWLWFIVLVDLLPLLYFKYANFGIDMLNSLLRENLPLQDIVLPVGISFYTFQAISHTVDVYRRRLRLKMDFLEYIFYLSFFPLLLAGPITRAGNMLRQMREQSPVDPRLLYTGLWLVMMGILKKCVVADYIAQFNNWAFDEPALYNGFELLMAGRGESGQMKVERRIFPGSLNAVNNKRRGFGEPLRKIDPAFQQSITDCQNVVLPYKSYIIISKFFHNLS
jgi:D-alanyl-lipoteichoic acid acyltransferase DltB (MBOAT superfamily)